MTHQPTMQPLFLFAAILFASLPSFAEEERTALHDRIDGAIEAAHVGPFAEISNDYEFLRRVYLDLIGRTPTSTELRKFASEATETKRERVVNKLLASDEFNQHFVRVLDVMLMERRSGKRVDQQAWLEFLSGAVSEKWSYDRIVATIMTADGSGDQRGAAKWLLAREVEPNALTRDIGRLFFGRDLQCAQCHDHPNIDDYLQSEYYGIYAFVNRSYLFEDDADNKRAYVGEKAEGETEFQSVFFPDDGSTKTIPTLLEGLALDVEPKATPTAYLVEPSKTAAGVPRFSRRTHLARLITHPQNEHFAKNTVNRFWTHMFGRGFVHPVDFHYQDNPPSHPALLKLLADEFVAMGFDYRKLLKEIALSDAYQRSIDLPPMEARASQPEQKANLDERLKVLRQELGELADATHEDAVAFEQQLDRRRTALSQLDTTIQQTIEKRKADEEEKAKLTKTLAAAKKQLATQQAQLKTVQAAADAAKKAKNALPKDTALTNAWKEFEKRVQTLTKHVDAKNKTVEQHNKKLRELTTGIASRDRELTKLQGQRVGLADMVAEARGAVGVFRTRQRRDAARRVELERRIASATALNEFWTLSESTRLAQQQAAASAIQIRKAESELSNTNEEVSALQGKLAAVRQSIKTNQQEVATAQEAVRQKQELLAGLQLVVENLETSEHLAGQTDVALTVLEKQKSDQSKELAGLETRLAEEERRTKGFSSELAKLEASESQAVATLQKTQANLVALKQQHEGATAKKRSTVAELDLAEKRIRDSWQQGNAVRSLNPLTPEQLAGATIAGLGLDVRYRNEATREWEKNQKSKAEKKEREEKEPQGNDTARIDGDDAKKFAEIESLYQKRVNSVLSTYVSMFAAPAGAPQDVFSATADQALFLSNDGRFQNWLAPSEGTLLRRLQSISDVTELANELYLSLLCRPPTEVERHTLEQYLAERTKDKKKALQEIAWGLLSSLEFRFNH